jgi:hypothetical protein
LGIVTVNTRNRMSNFLASLEIRQFIPLLKTFKDIAAA